MDDTNLLEQVRLAEARIAMLAPDGRFSDAAAALGARVTYIAAGGYGSGNPTRSITLNSHCANPRIVVSGIDRSAKP